MITELLGRFAAGCTTDASTNFFGIPTWYKYLKVQEVIDASGAVTCQPQLTGITDVWLIVMAIIDILLRVATILAIGFVLWGGIQYIKSQGRSEELAKARSTIIYALVGVVLTVAATVLVTFVAGQFK